MNKSSIGRTIQTALLLLTVCGLQPTLAQDDKSPEVPASDRLLVEKFPNSTSMPSLVQVLANQDHFDGKTIRLSGFLTVGFEDSAIYLSKDDALYHITANGLWIEFEQESPIANNATDFDNKYVVLSGKFKKGHRGHLSLWQGSLVEVKEARLLPKRKSVE